MLSLPLGGAAGAAPRGRATTRSAEGKTGERGLGEVKAVLAEEQGDKTVVRIRSTGTPTFTAYRLERPARVVIDLANSGLASSVESPMDVGSWSVSQVASMQFRDESSAVTRIMIALRRNATYDVKADASDVVVVVSPTEPKPADAALSAADVAKARGDLAQAKRETEAAKAAAAKARQEAEAARADSQRAQQEADLARQQVAQASSDAEQRRRELAKAKQELDNSLRVAEEARRASERSAAEAKRAAQTGEEERRKAAEQARREADRARAEAEAARVQAEAAQRQAKLAVEQAEARRLELERQAASAQGARAEAERRRLDDEARAEAARRQAEAAQVARQRDEKTAAAAKAEAQAARDERAKVEKATRELERLRRDEEAALARLSELRAAAEKAEARQAQAEAHKAKRAVVRAETERTRIDAERARTEQQLADLKRAAAEQERRLGAAGGGASQAASGGASQAAEANVVQLVNVRFVDRANSAEVVVDLNGDTDYTVVDTDRRTVVLQLRDTEIPKKLERALDTRAFGGPVQVVSSFREPRAAHGVRIVVELRDEVRHRVRRENRRLVWEFDKSAPDGDSMVAARPAGSQVPIARRPAAGSSDGAWATQRLPALAPQPGSRVAVATPAGSYPPSQVAGYGVAAPVVAMGAAAQAQSVGRSSKKFSGRRIDLDFKDADIHNILRLLSDVGQVNIVTADDIKGAVTIRMRNVPWDQALDVILKSKGFAYVREQNLIRVATAEQLDKERKAELERQAARVALEPLQTRIVPMSYQDANKMTAQVKDLLSPRGRLSVDERTNVMIITDIGANLALIQDLVQTLDTQTPQVMIESRIVEAQTNFTREVGVQWGGNALANTANGTATGLVFPSSFGVAGGATDNIAPRGGIQGAQATNPNFAVNLPATVGTGRGGAIGFNFGSIAGSVNLNLRLSAAEETGVVRIVSAPKVMTLDNVEASIEDGVSIPISQTSAQGVNTVFIDAKLNLTVKPHVTADGSIVMKVHVTRNQPDFSRTGARGDPTILKKEARTEMLVRDGDTVVLGGIYSRNSGVRTQKIPLLAEIPVLGWLFKNRRTNDDRTETLVFITPRIVNRAQTVAAQ
jgi:type IV pilus assembly protein PilQ